ncbi:hypothetical protein J2TS6_45830 [Paenibacillus albilobatus]|uniref:Uncharacterized protein n=1 Tax=Paenibacillus albilobatus TaxID=2716884 RepID=A0A919XML0_9BACL|nr:hypothetical protein J2TS6_45830 [Paenibacillus albilobatus]
MIPQQSPLYDGFTELSNAYRGRITRTTQSYGNEPGISMMNGAASPHRNMQPNQPNDQSERPYILPYDEYEYESIYKQVFLQNA